ncbi:MAG: MBL fold metallo-hydrolase [Halomonadaceae bacterium]|nr:MAG: MBL fold metallo-hydrolase [Halomonadaceae bacterium]
MSIRPAATLVLAREGDQGVEILLLQRTHSAVFMPGFYVFPGGAVDPGDDPAAHDQPPSLSVTDASVSAMMALEQGGLSYLVAAVRECFEEAGVLLAHQADGQPAQGSVPYPQVRRQLCAGDGDFLRFCGGESLHLPLHQITYVGHWVTPPGAPRRYDTRFFLAAAPPGQVASHDGEETIDHAWLTPEQALEDHQQGRRLFAPPTLRTLRAMTGFREVDSLLAQAGQQAPDAFPTQPWPAMSGERAIQLQPGEPGYDEVRLLDPERRGHAHSRIQPGRPVPLSATITRLTAANRGPMTGPGTNTYIVGDSTGVVVIDPGPASESHCDAIMGLLAERPLQAILVTHTHPDHSPGAALLKARTNAPVMGMAAPGDSSQDRHFRADRLLEDGDRIAAGPVTLRALHTPGHASNHLCFIHEQEQVLFAGDQIMQGSTVVINPPDGDMLDYLASLDRLLHEELRLIAPGHGFVMAHPHGVVDYLSTHRLAREHKVLRAMEHTGPATLEALTPVVYDDVPVPLQALGARSLLAHLLKLEKQKRARCVDGVWSLLAP